jgi:ABC-type transport system substrate-binding protein
VNRPTALLAAIAVSLLAVSGASGTSAQTPKQGGTVVVGGAAVREPGCLNAYLERCGSTLPDVSILMSLALRGAFAIGDDNAYRPDLVSRVGVTMTPPYTLTYHIRPEARWSDGVPITAGDFVFTHAALRSVKDEIAARPLTDGNPLTYLALSREPATA